MSWKTKLAPAVKELRFLFCQTSGSSEGTRAFIKQFGEEKGVRVSDLSEKQIDTKLKELLQQG